MPLTRIEKEEVVAGLREEFAQAEHAVLIDYLGLTVEQVNELRDKVRENEGKYRVMKNSLANLALEGSPLEPLREYLEGPVAIAWHPESPVTLAKVMVDFVKEHEKVVELRAGVLEGKAADLDTVREFAAMPSADELKAKLVFLLQSPMQRTVRLLQTVQKNLVVVLSEGAKKKDGE